MGYGTIILLYLIRTITTFLILTQLHWFAIQYRALPWNPRQVSWTLAQFSTTLIRGKDYLQSESAEGFIIFFYRGLVYAFLDPAPKNRFFFSLTS